MLRLLKSLIRIVVYLGSANIRYSYHTLANYLIVYQIRTYRMMNKLILATYFHQFHQHAYAELLLTKMPLHSTSISLTFLRLTDSLILA